MEGDQYEVVIALNLIGGQLKRIADMMVELHDEMETRNDAY